MAHLDQGRSVRTKPRDSSIGRYMCKQPLPFAGDNAYPLRGQDRPNGNGPSHQVTHPHNARWSSRMMILITDKLGGGVNNGASGIMLVIEIKTLTEDATLGVISSRNSLQQNTCPTLTFIIDYDFWLSSLSTRLHIYFDCTRRLHPVHQASSTQQDTG